MKKPNLTIDLLVIVASIPLYGASRLSAVWRDKPEVGIFKWQNMLSWYTDDETSGMVERPADRLEDMVYPWPPDWDELIG